MHFMMKIPESHIQMYREFDKDRREWYVHKCFSSIARQNEEIQSGEIKKEITIRAGKESKSDSTLVVISEKENPLIQSDTRALGLFRRTYDEKDAWNEQTTTEFHFYDTLIKIVTYKTSSPDDKQTGYIVNYQ